MAELAFRLEATALAVPPGNADEAAMIQGLTVRTAPDLRQLVEQLNGNRPFLRVCRSRPESQQAPIDASGQARHALVLAAAGGHHLLQLENTV